MRWNPIDGAFLYTSISTSFFFFTLSINHYWFLQWLIIIDLRWVKYWSIRCHRLTIVIAPTPKCFCFLLKSISPHSQVKDITQPSRDGCFVHGLSLQGARWDIATGNMNMVSVWLNNATCVFVFFLFWRLFFQQLTCFLLLVFSARKA